MRIKEILQTIESTAPLSLQESYDNSGLLTGQPNDEAKGALITLDVTESIIDEAIILGYNLVIAHHPVIFKALKKINGASEVERCIIKAIRNDIALYAAHTNLDNSLKGVNAILCEKLGIVRTSILRPLEGIMKKLVVFVPVSHADKVREAIFEAGAGQIGNYDFCSFNVNGTGTFRANENADPFVGKAGLVHNEPEVRIETIVPSHAEHKVLSAMLAAHPYEEVAWDSYSLTNAIADFGAGMIGYLENETDETAFLKVIRQVLGTACVKYSPLTGRKISKVAVCGGSGNFLIQDAMSAGADVFITGELKYHDYFLAEGRILLVEAGHYETEQFTKELLNRVLKEKFPTFALRISSINTNPVNCL